MYHYYQNWQHKSCIVFLKLATFKDLSCLFYQPLCCEIHLYCEIHYVAASINIIIKFLRCYFTIHYTFTEHPIKLCKINYIFTTTTWGRMNIGANCTRLWNISFSIFPTKSNSIYHQNYWQICIMKPHGNHWPSKRQSAATPRVSSSLFDMSSTHRSHPPLFIFLWECFLIYIFYIYSFGVWLVDRFTEKRRESKRNLPSSWAAGAQGGLRGLPACLPCVP